MSTTTSILFGLGAIAFVLYVLLMAFMVFGCVMAFVGWLFGAIRKWRQRLNESSQHRFTLPG